MLLLILIALVLPLSAARSVAAEDPSQPNQGTQTQTPTQQHNAASSSAAPALVQPTATPTGNTGGTYIRNQYYQSGPWGDLPTWLQAVGAIGLLIFAGWQARFIRRSTAATEQAANAARDAVKATEQYVELTKGMAEASKQSAQAAQLALREGRPYLVIENVKITGIRSPDAKRHSLLTGFLDDALAFLYATVNVTNFGKSPALIDKIIGAMSLEAELPKVSEFSRCEEQSITVDAVAPNATFSILLFARPAHFSKEDFDAIGSRTKLPTAFGRIYYRGLLNEPNEQPYTTDFCWFYRIPPALLLIGRVWTGEGDTVRGKEDNQRT